MGSRFVLSVSPIEKKGYAILFQDEPMFFIPRGSCSDTTIVLGVRGGQPMRFMANRKIVKMNRDRVAPKVVQTHMELDFKGNQQIQRETNFRKIQQGQRESQNLGSNEDRILPRLLGRFNGFICLGRIL
jgi:hypothetical protein